MTSEQPFHFRQFSIRQDKCAMKLGTDSVLLGVFADCSHAAHILDIGTGTGILALIMAQKSNAIIDAVEIDTAAFQQASENFRSSPWRDRICAHHGSIQTFGHSRLYDLIICNPPYFRAKKNFSIADGQRATARHDKELPFETLCREVILRLSPEGNLWLILPVKEAEEFKSLASSTGLFLHHEILIHPRSSKPANRIIMSFGLTGRLHEQTRFVIYNGSNTPSPEYIEATREYYLWKESDGMKSLKW